MQLTKEELVKFRMWRNEKRKFWAQIFLWVVWGGTSLVLFCLLGDLVPEEVMSSWILYGWLSVLFFIMAGMTFCIVFTIQNSKKGKNGKT